MSEREDPMKTMPAGEFKARCLRVMEDVKRYRTPVLITKRGKPVAKLVPPDEPKDDVFGCMADKITVIDDVESPVLPPLDEWDMVRLPHAARFSISARKGKRPRFRRSKG